MKTSLVITLVVLAMAGLAGWRNQAELTRVTRAYKHAEKEAQALGITTASDNPLHRTRQPRQVQEGVVAADLIAFAMELQDLPELSDLALLDEREQRMLDWQRRLFALDHAAMEQLIGEIEATGGMREDTRQELLFLVMQTLAESHPDAALDLIADSPDLLKNPVARAQAAAAALLRKIATDPAAGCAWFKSHLDLFPDSLARGVSEYLMRGTSLTNPKAAFQLIESLNTLDAEFSVRMITNPARTSAQREATLAAFREYLATVEDSALREKLLLEGTSSMISCALYDGVDNAIEKIGGGRFSQEEIEAYAGRHSFNHGEGDTEKWLDWLLQTCPTEKMSSEIVPRIFADWTSTDYQAAGEWLTRAEEGPMKTAATANYVGTLAEHHPATAARWLQTLPPGEARDNLSQHVYGCWLRKDPAAAATFAEQNGIAK